MSEQDNGATDRDAGGEIEVLYIDDPTAIERLQQYSSDTQVKVTGVQTRKEVVDELQRETFDCVVTEAELPDVQWSQFVEIVAEAGDLPIVLYTAEEFSSIPEIVYRAVDTTVEKGSEQNREFLVEKIRGLTADDEGDAVGVPESDVTDRLDEMAMGGTAAFVVADGDIRWSNTAFVDAFPVDLVAGTVPDGGDFYERLAALRRESPTVMRELLGVRNRTHRGEILSIPLSGPDNDRRYYVHDSYRLDSGEKLEVFREVTDWATVLERLEQFELLVEHSRDALNILDAEANIEFMNRAGHEMLGYEPNELDGEHSTKVFASREELERGQRAVQELIEDPDKDSILVDLKYERKDGTIIEIANHATLRPSEDGSYAGLVGVWRDVTERRKWERRLEEYQRLVESAGDPMWVLDDDGSIKLLNGAMADAFGTSKSALRGTDVREVLPPDGVEMGEDAIRTILSSAGSEWETFETVIEEASGDERTYEVTVGVIRDDEGRFNGSVATFRDITERKQKTEELQRQNDRLDQFASVVSHDLRNPLTIAQSYLELAEESGDPAQFEKVQDALDRMEAMIEDLLTMARVGGNVEETDSVYLETVVNESWDHVETAESELTLDISSGERLSCDHDRALNLFENLFRNAVDHNDPPVTVRVGTLDGETDSKAGSGFYVEDDGNGIPEDERADIFDHGYTTSDDGLGFGLSIVQDVADAHGWGVAITDGTDGGARFEIHTD